MLILIGWLLQKPADLDLHCLQEKPADQDPYCLQELLYIWLNTVFERINGLKANLFFRTVTFSMDKYILAFLLVPGQAENFTISTSLNTCLQSIEKPFQVCAFFLIYQFHEIPYYGYTYIHPRPSCGYLFGKMPSPELDQ